MIEMEMIVATIARNCELIEVGTAGCASPRERMAFAMSPVGLRVRIRLLSDRVETEMHP